MVHADPYGIKPLKEVYQDPGCSNCMKGCDSCKDFLTIYHLSNVLQQKKLKLGDISHPSHHI